MNSFNHYAYGAVGEWLYLSVLGIETDEVFSGYRHIIISPQTGDALAYAKGSYKSALGLIRVSWEKTQTPGERRLAFTVPVNAAVKIRLEKGAVPSETDGLAFRLEDGYMTAESGSGSFEIFYRK